MKQPQNGGRGRPDFLLLVMTLLLVGFGLVMVYSASSSIALVEENDALHYTKRQLMWAGLGVFAMLFSMNIRYQVYKKLFLLYFLPVMALLILVPFIAPDINGAKSWINIAGFTIQPTEPAKLAVILYLGALISKKGDKFRDFKKGLLPVIIIVGAVCGIIMMQPDLGSCLVLASCAIVMIFAGGANLKQAATSGLAVVLLVTVVFSISMAMEPKKWEYRIDRFTSYADPLADAQDSGWQLVSSLQAFGHGGISGAGFGESVQKLHYLQYAYNDFIFAVIGEEFGFIGGTLFLLFYLCFLWRGLIIALRCSDEYGTVVGVGIIGLLAIQAFINVGGVTGAIPLTGVTLPFISYGGSSLLVCLMSMGVLLSISRESNRSEKASTSRSTTATTRSSQKTVSIR